MKEKVKLRIRMLPSCEDQEVWVPLCLSVAQASELMEMLLIDAASHFVCVCQQPRLMLLEGERAGMLLEQSALVETLVQCGWLCDGCELALI